MTNAQQKTAARKFAAKWKGYEEGETQKFWLALLRDVFGIEEPENIIDFEKQTIVDGHKKRIDGYIKPTGVLIEQKSLGVNLLKPTEQSDHAMLTPFQQAKRYGDSLPHSEHPRWIVTCNFAEFRVYDMENPQNEPEVIELANLERDYSRLKFLIDVDDNRIESDVEISLEAGKWVRKFYNALLEQYTPEDRTDSDVLKSLNILTVRLVFCLYAQSSKLFGDKRIFHEYLKNHSSNARGALLELFKILDTKIEDRDKYLDEELAAFPYVNGGLFTNREIIVPRLNAEIVDLILKHASDFDWSGISPTIFGSIFESTLNPSTRRTGGMHYTSPENIHKVIDPLFLDDLRTEFDEIMETVYAKTRHKKLLDFQTKLVSLTFFDPSCGSGNFLTETYLSLRKLENKIINELHNSQVLMDFANPIKISLAQFYGIEINDFAVAVAKTALWIAESQSLRETENILHESLDFLPLKTSANITEGNALRLDWLETGREMGANLGDRAGASSLMYIMGNPPFVGYKYQSAGQKSDLVSVCVGGDGQAVKGAGKIDYVSGWYFKAARLMREMRDKTGAVIRAAFVSTNSITQGEQVAAIWKPLSHEYNLHIDFAYRTFVWASESDDMAHVHCVVIGFSVVPNDKPQKIFTVRLAGKGDGKREETSSQVASNINGYLQAAPDVFVESRTKPLCDSPTMISGNRPADGGNLLLTAEEYNEIITRDPIVAKYIKRYMMGYEFINDVKRYCLWLVDAEPCEIKRSKFILERVALCKADRLASPDTGRQKLATTPSIFREQLNPDHAVVIPFVSSERREYIPMGYIGNDIIAGDGGLFLIPNGTLYHFGVLTSGVHMAWVRVTCGRLKSDYRYSAKVVYNNFPWPSPTDKQRDRITATAQAILDARGAHPTSTLADLYDPNIMPLDLRKAHEANDNAVKDAYNFPHGITEDDCVTELMRMYQKLATRN